MRLRLDSTKNALPLVFVLGLACASAAQSGPWKDGELVVFTTKPVTGTYVLNRIDPATGQGANFVDVNYPGGWSGMVAFDSYRSTLLANVSLPPDGPFTYRLWSIASNGAAVSVPGLDNKVLRALAPAGDGRVFFMEHGSAITTGPIQWIDASNGLHTLMDASGSAPFVFPLEHMLYHAPSNALIGSNSGWWSVNDCSSNGGSFFRVPLSADGTRVGGPITCSTYATNNEEIMGLDYLPGGHVLATIASGSYWPSEKLVSVDPLTLAVAPWANTNTFDVNGGCWSSRIGKAVILDDSQNVLRTVNAGASGIAPVLTTTINVSDGSSGYSPAETLYEIDLLGPGCFGFADAYGSGLAGKGGFTPTLTLNGCPDIGKPISIAATQVVGGAPGYLAIASSPASLPFLGGTLLVSPAAVTLPILASGTPGTAGAGTYTLPFTPTDPSLVGLSLYLQTAFLDTFALQSISLSNGLQISFG